MKVKKKMVIGIVLTLVVSFVAEFAAKYLPQLGAESIAMLLGLVLGNTLFTNEKWGSGVKWSEKYPIEVGIALLGMTITLKTIESLGWTGIAFILIQMIGTIIFVMVIGGRVFKVSAESSMLMAAGNAVCGSSAIASVAPAIGAKDNQRRTAVATVSLSGIVLMLLLPLLGTALWPHGDMLIGALIGGTVQSVGQVVGSAALVNTNVVTYATLFKMLRIILLSVVVFFMAQHAQKLRAKKASESAGVDGDTVQAPKSFKIPWFIVVFLILLIINTVISLPTTLTHGAKMVSSFFSVVNLAGIGLNLKWSVVKSSGLRYMSYGLVTIIFQTVLALVLIIALLH